MPQIDDDALAKQYGAVNSVQPQPQSVAAQPPEAQPAQGGQPQDDDALAAQYGAVAPQAAAAGSDKPEESLGEEAHRLYDEYNTGVLKGVGQTVHGVGELIRHGVNIAGDAAGGQSIGVHNLGDKLIPEQGQKALDEMSTARTPAEHVGTGAEMLLEMMSGEGILAKIPLAERLVLGSKLAKLADDYPILGKLLTKGLAAVKGAARTTAVGTLTNPIGGGVLHGEPVADAVKHGAELGVGNEALKATAGAAGSAYSHIFNPETGLVARATQGEALAQAPARQALEGAASSFNKTTNATTGIRELLTPEIQKAADGAETIYDKVERITGFDLKTTQTKLFNTERQIDELTATEADKIKEAQLEKSRTELIDEVDEAKKALVAKGENPNLIDQADALYKKESALKDVQAAVFGNEGLIEGNLKYGKKEMINVGSALKNLQKLTAKTKYGPDGRLAQAIGKDAETKLMQKLYDAHELGQKAIPANEVWKYFKKRALIYGAVAAGGGAIGGAIAHSAAKAALPE